MSNAEFRIERMARSDATYDGRQFDTMSRHDKDRYVARARAAFSAAMNDSDRSVASLSLVIPALESDRAGSVDSLVAMIFPQQAETDTYFVAKARSALNGFLHAIIAKVHDAKDYDGIPVQWLGAAPSIAMMMGWITNSKLFETDTLRSTAEKFRPSEGNSPGTSTKAYIELISLASMSPNERQGILTVMTNALRSH